MRFLDLLGAGNVMRRTTTPAIFASSRPPPPRLTNAGSLLMLEVHPRKDHRGVNLISDALPFGRLWVW